MTIDAQERSVVVLGADSGLQADGIRDYSMRLVRQLDMRDDTLAALYVRATGALDVAVRPLDESDGRRVDPGQAHAVVLQYNPFWHGRRGFAPGLALTMLRLRLARRRARRPVIALMVHETYVDAKNWKWALMRRWQQTQLLALQALSDVQLCAIERWTELLRRTWPRAPAHHLPVASNLPDRRAARTEARRALGVDDDTLVLATFAMYHPGRLTRHAEEAAAAAAADGRRVLLLNLGPEEPVRETRAPGLEVYAPGFLDAPEVASLLSGADIALSVTADGVSTRRTTVMAALQHEIAVVGTDGHLTDAILREAAGDALRLAPVDDRAVFVDAVRHLAADADARRAVGLAGRRLYETHFDWPVIVERLLETIDGVATR